MPTPEDLLNQFGYSQKETAIYLAALSLGKASVTDIAKKIGEGRTATYFHIKKLLEKGLLEEAREGKRFRFVAFPPSELAAKLDRITTELKSIVPQLEALKTIEQETPVIEVKESKAGYFGVYDEISSLPHGSTFRVMEGKSALEDELTLLTDEEWKTFFTRIIERKIETKGLFTEESLAAPTRKLTKENVTLLRKRIWHLRYLPEGAFPLQKLMFIYGDKIAFLFPETSLVVKIRHIGIAEVLAATFDALFQFATPKPAGWKE